MFGRTDAHKGQLCNQSALRHLAIPGHDIGNAGPSKKFPGFLESSGFPMRPNRLRTAEGAGVAVPKQWERNVVQDPPIIDRLFALA